MKKTTLAIALAFGVTSAFAQDLTSKKGEPILPEAGDWSIGIEANPYLDYLGNLLNGNTSNSSPTWNHLNGNNTIIGKMFKDEKTAYRGILRIGMTSSKSSAQIADASVTTLPTFPTAPTMKTDEMKSSSNFIGLGGGLEMRRGKTRLQGYYGGDLMFWMGGSKEKYTYGNTLSTTTGAASTANSTDFGSNIDPTYSYWGGRVTEVKTSKTLGFGLRGFIGAEYFIMPKISIAGEFGWGVGLSTNGERTATVEQFGGTGSVGTTDYVVAPKSGGFSLDTDQNNFGTASGALRLNLHF